MIPQLYALLVIVLLMAVTALYSLATNLAGPEDEQRALEAKLSRRGYRWVLIPPDLAMHDQWEGVLILDDLVMRRVTSHSKRGAMRKLGGELAAVGKVAA